MNKTKTEIIDEVTNNFKEIAPTTEELAIYCQDKASIEKIVIFKEFDNENLIIEEELSIEELSLLMTYGRDYLDFYLNAINNKINTLFSYWLKDSKVTMELIDTIELPEDNCFELARYILSDYEKLMATIQGIDLVYETEISPEFSQLLNRIGVNYSSEVEDVIGLDIPLKVELDLNKKLWVAHVDASEMASKEDFIDILSGKMKSLFSCLGSPEAIKKTAIISIAALSIFGSAMNSTYAACPPENKAEMVRFLDTGSNIIKESHTIKNEVQKNKVIKELKTQAEKICDGEKADYNGLADILEEGSSLDMEEVNFKSEALVIETLRGEVDMKDKVSIIGDEYDGKIKGDTFKEKLQELAEIIESDYNSPEYLNTSISFEDFGKNSLYAKFESGGYRVVVTIGMVDGFISIKQSGKFEQESPNPFKNNPEAMKMGKRLGTAFFNAIQLAQTK